MVYSIHIPKTMGSSFGDALCKTIPNSYIISNCPNCDKYLVEDGISTMSQKTAEIERDKECQGCITLDEVHANIRSNRYSILHGHPSFHIINVLEDTQVITWLRNPIQRVIFHYFFDERHGNTELGIYEFVEEQSNIYQKYLQGIKEFFFIGIVENKDMDLVKFFSMSNVYEFEIETLNTNPNKQNVNETYKYDLDLYNHIVKHNGRDIQLYNTVCLNIGRRDLIID